MPISLSVVINNPSVSARNGGKPWNLKGFNGFFVFGPSTGPSVETV